MSYHRIGAGHRMEPLKAGKKRVLPWTWCPRCGIVALKNRATALVLRVLLALRDCGYEVEVHAFPLPGSKGTWDMVNQAKSAGVAVHVHEVAR